MFIETSMLFKMDALLLQVTPPCTQQKLRTLPPALLFEPAPSEDCCPEEPWEKARPVALPRRTVASPLRLSIGGRASISDLVSSRPCAALCGTVQ